MAADPVRRLASAACSTVLALGSLTACTSAPPPDVRIGVLADCVGLFRSLNDLVLSGAQLPLLERGAQASGSAPSDGLEPLAIGVHGVELVPGCVEGGGFTTIIEEARRLVETEHVDAVVGATWPGDGLVLRDVAARYPDTLFVAATAGPREVTLLNGADNLVRLAPDYAQSVAGLGARAREDLGWRAVHVITENSELGWLAGAAFAAQFCSPGRRLEVTSIDWGTQPPVSRVLRTDRPVDGTVVLTDAAVLPARLPHALGVLSPSRLLLGPGVVDQPGFVERLPAGLDGTTGMSTGPPSADPATLDYQRSYAEHFPGLPAAAAFDPAVLGFRDAVESIVSAVAASPSDAAVNGSALIGQLRSSPNPTLAGPTSLDQNGQGLATVRLVRLTLGGGDPSLTVVSEERDVDQTLSGVLPRELQPTADTTTCRT